jgi:hypothetical protein
MDESYSNSFDDCCPECGGLGCALGTLGMLLHLRCRDCGMDWSVPSPDAYESDWSDKL